MAHEHILTKDAEGEVWIVLLEKGEIRLYPFFARTSRNGQEERQQFEAFIAKLPQDYSFHRYVYEGEAETLRMTGAPQQSSGIMQTTNMAEEPESFVLSLSLLEDPGDDSHLLNC